MSNEELIKSEEGSGRDFQKDWNKADWYLKVVVFATVCVNILSFAITGSGLEKFNAFPGSIPLAPWFLAFFIQLGILLFYLGLDTGRHVLRWDTPGNRWWSAGKLTLVILATLVSMYSNLFAIWQNQSNIVNAQIRPLLVSSLNNLKELETSIADNYAKSLSNSIDDVYGQAQNSWCDEKCENLKAKYNDLISKYTLLSAYVKNSTPPIPFAALPTKGDPELDRKIKELREDIVNVWEEQKPDVDIQKILEAFTSECNLDADYEPLPKPNNGSLQTSDRGKVEYGIKLLLSCYRDNYARAFSKTSLYLEKLGQDENSQVEIMNQNHAKVLATYGEDFVYNHNVIFLNFIQDHKLFMLFPAMLVLALDASSLLFFFCAKRHRETIHEKRRRAEKEQEDAREYERIRREMLFEDLDNSVHQQFLRKIHSRLYKLEEDEQQERKKWHDPQSNGN
ncbi:hypothetical protein GCM10011332_32260 [Terasakiella brassicae]|uniref:Uncharacterized protein n=1 Tax=Terasakiella brassicae TaxID=1634917 RepID=A0A917C9X6_9PROT|nr:hypothetical protein [Terasakiella brassicae]GGF75805.1 hypothetical protein GCM10011332_32260 [Terasakiella brassicae]